jgi:hypothetical protein
MNLRFCQLRTIMTHNLPRRSTSPLKDFAQGVKRLFAAKRDLPGLDSGNAVGAHDVVGNTLGEGRRIMIVKLMLCAFGVDNDVPSQLAVVTQM